MNEKTRERVALGLGILAGTAIGLFLNSDKGREVRRETGEKLNEFGTEANSRIQHLAEEAKGKIDKVTNNFNEMVQDGKNYITDTGEVIREKFSAVAHNAEEKVDHANSEFKAGVDYAIRNIKKKAKELEKNYRNAN